MFGRVGAQEPSASATTTNRNCIFTSRPISILRIDSHEFMYSGNLAQFDELGWRIEADWLNAASTCINNKSPRKDCRQQFASLGATPRGNGRWNSRPVLPDDFASSPTSLPIRPRPKGTSPGRWTGDDPSLQRLPSHRLPTPLHVRPRKGPAARRRALEFDHRLWVPKDRYTGRATGETVCLGYDKDTGTLHETQPPDDAGGHGFSDTTKTTAMADERPFLNVSQRHPARWGALQ
ncbi:hypothetical protein J3R73_002432 [Labrys monachus]|uniref:Uncharacterized protein n=1 Tax=Labrys monachus TaxID=217067 RepID=A0ABU0FF31_9HYPH|nr:hypothetical protein [Labrys monachus]